MGHWACAVSPSVKFWNGEAGKFKMEEAPLHGVWRRVHTEGPRFLASSSWEMEKASPFPSEIGDAFRKGSENVPTLRFTLSLPASDDKTCPEYSFLDLVKSATRKVGESFSRFSVQSFSLKRRQFRVRRTPVCIFLTAVRMAVILIPEEWTQFFLSHSSPAKLQRKLYGTMKMEMMKSSEPWQRNLSRNT